MRIGECERDPKAAGHAGRRPGARRTSVALVLLGLAAPLASGAQERVELPAEDRPLEVQVTPVYELGGFEGEGWQAFQRIRDLGFDGRGLLHILDQGASVVYVVGRGGERIRSVGGKGDGPGEVSAAVGMSVAADGTFVVEDVGRRSLAVFGPDGSYLENARIDGSRGRISSLALHAEGYVVGFPSLLYSGRQGSSEISRSIRTEDGMIEDPPGHPLLRAGLDGSEAELLRWNWLAPRKGDDGRVRETAFLPEIQWELLPDGRVAVVDSLDYGIHLVGGEEEVVLTRPLSPPEVTAAHRRAEIERRAAEGGGVVSAGGGGAAAGLGSNRQEATRQMLRQRRAQLEESLDFFSEHQVIRALKADPAGRLWVERVGDDPHAPGPIDVLTFDGRYLGTVRDPDFRLPDAFGPDGLAVWLTTDDFDVPVVTVRRVSLD